MAQQNEIRNLEALWAIRAVLRPHFLKSFGRLVNDDALRLLGLEDLIDSEVSKSMLKKRLVARLNEIENGPLTRKGRFFLNVNHLADTIGLSAFEREILIFSILLKEGNVLREVMECLGNVSLTQLVNEVAAILKVKPSIVQKALGKGAALRSSGLIQLDNTPHLDIVDRIDTLKGFGWAIIEKDFETALSSYFHKAPEPKLVLDDFPHLEKDLGILVPFLKAGLKEKMSGINILLYGQPGTGKTELVRSLSSSIGAKLFEVSSQDDDGDPADSDDRFRAYLLCQRIFDKTKDCLIVFDEVEDAFPVDDFVFFGPHRRTGGHKGWTNRLLENNRVPAIWVGNSISQMDPAFIRRFDMVFEVPVPPRPITKRILKKHIGKISVSETWLQKMAENKNLAPSHIEKAAKVAMLLGKGRKASNEAVMEHLIANSHKALGYRQDFRWSDLSRLRYDLRFTNTDQELRPLVEACRNNAVRVCLYGPPGSGKTAFVHYLGQELGKPVLLKRASDLLNCYIGQTEQNIADMFRQATDEGAILLLDEADSFLQNRTRAQHSWEVTQVNELLVQMESFGGQFFCCTNLMDLLDSAVFRRFDLKVKFDYLSCDQALSLFGNFLKEASHMLSAIEVESWKRKLADLGELTPGDFAVVKRRLILMNRRIEPSVLFEELKKECAIKPKTSKTAGFLPKAKA
ncbi:MAG: AAA family ATPase [Syntrophobacteraceae bacterium]